MTTAAVRPAGLGNLWTLPGGYAPQADTFLLAEALRAEGIAKGTDLLDVTHRRAGGDHAGGRHDGAEL